MRKNIIRDSINCLGEAQLEDTTYKIARDITLCYLQELEEEYKELEDRINKAIKYIEENSSAFNGEEEHLDKVYTILKGGENESRQSN